VNVMRPIPVPYDPLAWVKKPFAERARMVCEGLGLGCGFGPLIGHYFPSMGGFLHFLRPGTTKPAVFPRLPPSALPSTP
jgi:hypothetical protein